MTANTPVIEVTETYDRLGGAANAAANCAALGARTRLVGVTGADRNGLTITDPGLIEIAARAC